MSPFSVCPGGGGDFSSKNKNSPPRSNSTPLIKTQSASKGTTHKQTEGRAPEWALSLLQKPLHFKKGKGSEELVHSPFVVAFVPIFARAYGSEGFTG
jgi:hypothetical protein